MGRDGVEKLGKERKRGGKGEEEGDAIGWDGKHRSSYEIRGCGIRR